MLTRKTIQRPHLNAFRTIWEYQTAFENERIDWSKVLASRCPICDRKDCLRQIRHYTRSVIDLLPWKTGEISVARFLCQKTGKTVSFLPCQLAPYHRYTIESMFAVLLLVSKFKDDGNSVLGVSQAVDSLAGDSDLSEYLVTFWCNVFIQSFQRAVPFLVEYPDLANLVNSAKNGSYEIMNLVAQMFTRNKDPPHRNPLGSAVKSCIENTHQFLVGTPSHERRGAAK